MRPNPPNLKHMHCCNTCEFWGYDMGDERMCEKYEQYDFYMICDDYEPDRWKKRKVKEFDK